MNKKRKIIIISVSLLIISAILVADLVSKHFLMNFTEEKTIIPYIINFYSTKNTGVAWSVFSNSTSVLIVVSIIAIILIVLYAIFAKNNSIFFYVSLSLIVGGAIGNLVDRIALGYVRDFIQFAFWKSFPIFNLADCALTIGIICLIIYYLITFVKEKRKKWLKSLK